MVSVGDPDAIYDLPEEKRNRVIGMVYAMRKSDGFATNAPLTIRQMHKWALAVGILKKKGGDDG